MDALLATWRARYEAAKGFPPAIVRGRDLAILNGLLATQPAERIERAMAAMLAHGYFGRRAHLLVLREHFGELVESGGASRARREGPADEGARLRDALVASAFRSTVRSLPAAWRDYESQLRAIGLVREIVAEGWAHGGCEFAAAWVERWQALLRAAIGGGESRPLDAAARSMQAWRERQRQGPPLVGAGIARESQGADPDG